MLAYLKHTLSLFPRSKSCLVQIGLAGAGELLALFKISFIVGSSTGCFSATQAYTPILGRRGGTKTSISYYVLRTLYRICITGSLSSLVLFYHIPTFFGSMYSSLLGPSQTSWVLKIALSLSCLLCILLFGMHPIGSQALPYAAFWVVPLVMPFVKTNNRFAHALAGTLAVHAVGSILWLHTHSMSPQVWLALIPLVCIERIVFALGAVCLDTLYSQARAFFATASVSQHRLSIKPLVKESVS